MSRQAPAPAAAALAGAVHIDDRQLGDDYGIATAAMLSALRLMARSEGRLPDPLYSGKAFSGSLADVEAGRYRPGQAVLFLMTG